MREWHVAAAVLVAALIPCGWVCVRRSFAEGVVAVQIAGTVAALALLVLAVLSFVGTLVFLRFLERMR